MTLLIDFFIFLLFRHVRHQIGVEPATLRSRTDLHQTPRCQISFSRRPNFDSIELFASGLNVANLMRYAPNAPLFKSKITFYKEINFTECLIGSPYLLGPLFDLPLLRTEVSPSSDSWENPGGLSKSPFSPVASLGFSISSAAGYTPLSNT